MTKTVNSVTNKSTFKSEEKTPSGGRKSDLANHLQCWNGQMTGHNRYDSPTSRLDRPECAVCYWFSGKHY